MIRTQQDLQFYLAADKFALGKTRARPRLLSDAIWKFQIALRKLEYYQNIPSTFRSRMLLKYYTIQKERLGFKLGFDIPPNVFGPGLRINHFGSIVVHGSAKVGMWCDIHQGVNIGNNPSRDGSASVPILGDNVWIGPGAKLFGRITIGSGVAIGANAVVNKDFSGNLTIAGIPAHVIGHEGTATMNVSANVCRTRAFMEKYTHDAERLSNLGISIPTS